MRGGAEKSRLRNLVHCNQFLSACRGGGRIFTRNLFRSNLFSSASAGGMGEFRPRFCSIHIDKLICLHTRHPSPPRSLRSRGGDAAHLLDGGRHVSRQEPHRRHRLVERLHRHRCAAPTKRCRANKSQSQSQSKNAALSAILAKVRFADIGNFLVSSIPTIVNFKFIFSPVSNSTPALFLQDFERRSLLLQSDAFKRPFTVPQER